MYPNWGNVQGGYAIYGQVDPNYQQQMLQWQQMNQMGGQQWGTFVQPAPPLPTGGEAKPPEPPADEKPPLPPEPPPEGGDTKVNIFKKTRLWTSCRDKQLINWTPGLAV